MGNGEYMKELGKKEISNSQQIVDIRVKLRGTFRLLGFSGVLITRMETLISEILHMAIVDGRVVHITAFLGEMNKEYGILLIFESNGWDKYDLAAPVVFEDVELTKQREDVVRLSLFKKRATWLPPLDEEIISKIEDYFTNPTNAELLDGMTKLNKELIVTKVQTEETTKAKSEFLANMSHEIRTPMNAIVGLTYLLSATELTEQQKDYTEKIYRSSQQLLSIVNDILDYSKISTGTIKIENVDFDIHGILENIFDLYGRTCEEKELELLFDIAPDVPYEMTGDPIHLGQILLNYVSNAVKFTEKGEIIIRIRKVSSDADQMMLRFEVEDTGIGLTNDEKNNLFQPFQQIDMSYTRKYGGTGLGLAIAKQLANLMGGDVGVNSEYEKGSTFWFTVVVLEQKNREQKKDKGGIQLANRKVLIVDDNIQAAHILREIVKIHGMIPETVDSGENALKLIKKADQDKKPYEIVYLDMRMSGLSGTETWKKIVTMDLHSRPKGLIMTSVGNDKVYQEAKEAGIEIVLIKPIMSHILIESTRKVLGDRTISKNQGIGHVMNKVNEHIALLKDINILLVEDSELNQLIVKELLKSSEIKIDIAANGKIAIDMVNKNEYDLVFMDMQMPVMDGLEATRRIRTIPKFSALPIIAMTANSLQEDKVRCVEAGMNDYMVKPIEPEKLFCMLNKWVSSKKGAVPCTENEKKEFQAKTMRVKTNTKAIFRIQVSGLNSDQGLNFVAGNEELYLSILRKYVEGHKDMIFEIRKAVVEERTEDARRMAHTLKGIAGNIGAETLQEKAKTLEYALRDGVTGKDIEKIIGEVEAIHVYFIKEISEALPKAEEVEEGGSEFSKKDMLDLLNELRPYVSSHKPKKCAEIMATYQIVKWPDELHELSTQFREEVRKYKYKEALQDLDEMIKTLKTMK